MLCEASKLYQVKAGDVIYDVKVIEFWCRGQNVHLLALNIPLTCPQVINHCIAFCHIDTNNPFLYFWIYVHESVETKLIYHIPIDRSTLIFLEHSCPNFLTTYQRFCHDRKKGKSSFSLSIVLINSIGGHFMTFIFNICCG